MIPYLVAAVGGALLAGRGKPNSTLRKMQCIGPRSGITYEVDSMLDSGMLFVHYLGAVGTFEKKPERGYRWIKGQGNPEVLAAMIRDFT